MWAFWQLGSKCREVTKSCPSGKLAVWYCFRQPPDNLQTRYNSKKQEWNFPFAFQTAKVPGYLTRSQLHALHSPIAVEFWGWRAVAFWPPRARDQSRKPNAGRSFPSALGREVSENCIVHPFCSKSRRVCLFTASPIDSSTWTCLSDRVEDVDGGILSWFEGLSRYFLLGS